MLKMRLQRTGRKNDPSFRVVVTDSRNGPRAGNPTDTIGSYSPRQNDFRIDADKAKYWLSKGVQPSGTIYNFLISKGVIKGKKRNVLPKKTPIMKEAEADESREETSKKESSKETTISDASVAKEEVKDAVADEKAADTAEEDNEEPEKKTENHIPEETKEGEEKEQTTEEKVEEAESAEVHEEKQEVSGSETDSEEIEEEKQS